MGPLIPNVKSQYFDINGDPLVGGKLYTYQAGTSTAIATYSEYTLVTANANPIILDSRGECNVWLADGTYKFVLKDSDDVTIWTEDNISIEDASATSLLSSKNTSGYADFTAAALTVSITSFSLAAKTVIEYLTIKHSTAFAGTSITSLLISVGITGDLTKYIDSFDVLQAVGDTTFETVSLHAIESFASATNIIISAVAIGANLDQLTAGSVDVYAKTTGMN